MFIHLLFRLRKKYYVYLILGMFLYGGREMVCVTENMLGLREFSKFRKYTGALSKRDIATLLDLYTKFSANYSSEDVDYVLKSNDGYFLFCINTQSNGTFDLFKYLNDGLKQSGDSKTLINCMNAKFMFPIELSIGEFKNNEEQSNYSVISDEATGYMDEEEILKEINMPRSIIHVSSGTTITIPKEGISIGRSDKDANFVVDNHNISRKHCIISSVNGKLYIKDLNSTNGIFLNGERIIENMNVQINSGDIVHIANEEFRVM